jgi:hypothetical protein
MPEFLRLLTEKRTAPSLSRVKADTISDYLDGISRRRRIKPVTQEAEANSRALIVMNDHIDHGEPDRLDDGQEESFDLDPEPKEFDEIDKA